MANRPLWRKTFDAVERPVGQQLERAVQTEQFADAAGLLLRLRAEVGRRIEQTSRRALHRVNLPAASDVAGLREQLAGLHQTIRRLEDELREQNRSTRGDHDGAGRPVRARTAGRSAQPESGPKRSQVRRRD